MSDNLSYIENYFNKSLTTDEAREFEERIEAEPAFAEEVAFYLSAKETAKQEAITEKKKRFRELYAAAEPAKVVEMPKSRRNSFRMLAVAASIIAVIILGVVFFNPSPSAGKLADQYINSNLVELPPSMSTQDSLEMGKDLFNKKDYTGALGIFESLLARDNTQTRAKEYAGIVSLHLKHYDKALAYFTELENTQLEMNPGKFYHALTLMKRNQQGDKDRAKELLQQVVNQSLSRSDVAKSWLENW